MYAATAQGSSIAVEAYLAYRSNALHQQIDGLQQQVSSLSHLQQHLWDSEARNAALSSANYKVTGDLLSSRRELNVSQNIAAAQDDKIDALVCQQSLTEEYYNSEAVKAREMKHNRSLRAAQNEVIDLMTENSELEGKLERARKRITDEQWDYEARSKVKREYQAKVDEQQQKIDQQAATIVRLKQETGQKDFNMHQLGLQVALLEELKMTIFRMISDGDDYQKVSATLYVAALKEHGLNLVKLDIDPQQHENYFIWAKDKILMGSSCLSPSTGFHLEGFRGLLTSVHLSNNKIFEPIKSTLNQEPVLGQLSWDTPQYSDKAPIGPAQPNVGSNSSYAVALPQGFETSNSATFGAARFIISSSGSGLSAPPSQPAAAPTTTSGPFSFTPSRYPSAPPAPVAGPGTTTTNTALPHGFASGSSIAPTFGVTSGSTSGPTSGTAFGSTSFGSAAASGSPLALGSTPAFGSASTPGLGSGSALGSGLPVTSTTLTTFGSATSTTFGNTSGSNIDSSPAGSLGVGLTSTSGSGFTPSFGSGSTSASGSGLPSTPFNAALWKLVPATNTDLFRHLTSKTYQHGLDHRDDLLSQIDNDWIRMYQGVQRGVHTHKLKANVLRKLYNKCAPNHRDRPGRVAKKGSLNRTDGYNKTHKERDILRGVGPRSRVASCHSVNTRLSPRNRR